MVLTKTLLLKHYYRRQGLWGIAQLSRDVLQNGVSHRCTCVKRSTKEYRTIFRKLEKAVAVRNSLLEKSSGKFRRCWQFFTDFPAARHAIPAKVWAFCGKENGCWKIGRACGNAAGFSPPRPPLFEIWGIAAIISLRAQRLKKFKIALRDWNFQSRFYFFCGEFNSEGLGLKISSEIENFNRD